MPLYEYGCRLCNERFEKLQPMSAERWAECPTCGQPAKRVFSLVAAPVHAGAGEEPSSFSAPSAGACCGGACGCA